MSQDQPVDEKGWIRDLKPGDRIVEKQSGSTPKTVERVVPYHYVMARGLNLRRIAWRNLSRYRPQR